MAGGLDANTIVAAASAEIAKDFLRATFAAISSKAQEFYESIFTNLSSHIADVHRRVTTVKIITSKDEPVDFKSIYVSSGFKCNGVKYSSTDIVDLLAQGGRSVISGIGGAGKTFAMRNFWLEIIRLRLGVAPIFIELRKLNSLSTYDISQFIRANSFGSNEIGERAFEKFCADGKFVFLLDGFDEVSREKREELERQIIVLSERFKRCGIVVSGRPDERFDSWSGFKTFQTEPLDYKQFAELIRRVPFDPETKASFQALAQKDFFARHQSFLSNPLLALMMLLTYRDNAEIPARISTFYENCFMTLYAQHDALKESFNRKKCLDQLQFKRVFSAFSLATYLASKTTLDGADLIQYIDVAKKISDTEASTDDIKHDFLESVNLLIKDGLYYSYIHRSFQEFFSAYCAVTVLSRKKEDVLLAFASRKFDRTLRLAYELNPKTVEDVLIIPRYNALISTSKVPRKITKTSPFNALFCAGLEIEFSIGVKQGGGRRLKRDFHAFGVQLRWDKRYEDLMIAVSVSSEPKAPDHRSAEAPIFHLAVRNILSEIVNVEVDSRDIEYDSVEQFVVSFEPDRANIAFDDESALLAHRDRFMVLISTCVDEFEKIVTSYNRALVTACERIVRRRSGYEDALVDLLT